MAIELSSDQLDALTVPEKVQSLDWNADVLAERRQRLLDGSAKRLSWDEAMTQLQRLAK
jgi:hypothetical protein